MRDPRLRIRDALVDMIDEGYDAETLIETVVPELLVEAEIVIEKREATADDDD
jgi:hypothetical protein